MSKPYFKHKNFSLYLDDSIKFLNENIKEDSVDMIFADPPYNLSNGGFTCQNGQMVSVNKGNWDVSNGLKDFLIYQVNFLESLLI